MPRAKHSNMDAGKRWRLSWGDVTTSSMKLVVLFSVLPLFHAQNKELSYTIYEEGPIPALVGNIARDSNVSQLLGSDVFSTLRYRVLSQPDTNSDLFTVGNRSGLLMTAARVDRETLCHFSAHCRLLVYVAIQQSAGAYFVTVKINVNVRDINDNDPQFPQASMSVPVTENSARESIDITPAMDLDIGQNTIQHYDLVAEDPTMFRLVVTPNLDGSLVPNLVINTELDRETRDFYKVVILAKDGGSEMRTGVLTLNITVEDVNDNAPVFTASEFNVSVNETLPRDTVVATVRATDRDIGFNGEVRYRFSPRQTDDNANAFTIHDTTGEIRTVQDLTHLQGKTLSLVVEAVDRGAKPLKAQAMLNVRVLDVVNNYPSIRLTTISGGNISLVKESAPTGYVVAHFIVVDTDTGTNGIVSCSVSGGNFALQKLVDKEYKITLVGSLNREQRDRFDVSVRCWDFGRPSSLTSSVSFSVIVEDVNDNTPVFSRRIYRRNVTEEQGPVVLMRVHAVDADIGENGRVTYRLGNISSFMTSLINVVGNGDIVAKASFDREVYKILDFIVVAVDHGVPQNTATARVILDIMDINDRKPSLPVGYTLAVLENQPRGTVVGTIEAIDEDEGNSGKISYHLLSDNNATRFFTVEKTGVVRTRMQFDREAREYYHLSVLANDLGDPPNTNILSVTVEITDENDNTPLFVRPNNTFNVVNISSVTPARSVIFRAKVKDADSGVNARVDFGFASDDYGAFAINRTSGTVSTIRNLQPMDSGTYRLVLLARDRGVGRARSAIATLSVVVVAENATMLPSEKVNKDHIIIVVVLVCLTVLTAVCVSLILLRLRHSDRRERRHHHGLPPDSKASYHLREDKSSWGGYDAVKGHGVEETGTPELGRESEDDLILFKLQLAEQYKERDLYSAKSPSPSRHPLVKDVQDTASSDVSSGSGNDVSTKNMTRLAALKVQQTLLQRAWQTEEGQNNTNGKTTHLEKPAQLDEMMSSSSRETNGTDSGRGCSEDDSQAVESIRSETESGFSSFLAMPLKDGWRHVGHHDYVNSQHTSLKTAHDSGHSPTYSTFSRSGCNHPADKLHDRNCACSMSDLDMSKGRMYENTSNADGSLKSFRTYTPKRPPRTVHFSKDGGGGGGGDTSSRQTLPSLSGKSREPRFQPQFQSSRPRSNPAQPANAVCDYVNMGSGGVSSGAGLSPTEGNPRLYGELAFYGSGRRDLTGDSLNDSADTADEGNTTTTSGSYTIDQEDNMQDLQSDIFV